MLSKRCPEKPGGKPRRESGQMQSFTICRHQGIAISAWIKMIRFERIDGYLSGAANRINFKISL
jgi:hypothetical protein